MSSFFPSIEEIEESIKNEPEPVRRKVPTNSKSFNYKRNTMWFSDLEKDKFLNDYEWNDFSLDEKVLDIRNDKHQDKFDNLKEIVTQEEFEGMIEALSLFVKNCIPKPLKSISLRGIYNGWTVSCLPEGALFARINVGPHVASDVWNSENGIFLTIYANKDILEKEFKSDIKNIELEYKDIGISGPFGTATAIENNLVGVSIPLKKVHTVLNDKRIILSSREFVTKLITTKQTGYHTAQCENLVQLILEKVQK
jgi:hypothetical protein